MRKVFSLVGVLLLLVILEGAGRGCANTVAEGSIKSKIPNVGSVTIQGGSPPYVLYWFGLGYMKDASIRVNEIVSDPISITRLQVSAAKLKLSRKSLVGGDAKITGEAPYDVLVVLDADDLSRAIGQPVRFHGTFVQTSREDGATINAEPEIDGETIVFADTDDPTVKVTVPLPDTDYLPCKPGGVGVQNAVVLGCRSASLPPVLAEAAS